MDLHSEDPPESFKCLDYFFRRILLIIRPKYLYRHISTEDKDFILRFMSENDLETQEKF